MLEDRLSFCEQSQVGLNAQTMRTRNDANVMAEKLGRAITSYDNLRIRSSRARTGELVVGAVLAAITYRAIQKKDYTTLTIGVAGLSATVVIHLWPQKNQ